jgi:CubicO group peptidase (beta-lactamase class C family)
MTATLDEVGLRQAVVEVLNRRPVAGLAVAVVQGDTAAWFHAHGLANVERGVRVDEDTVFRIGSITKTMTAISVMQLVEQGLLDLDAPVQRYLRSFRLLPADGRFSQVTPRHLLTHTGGVRAVRTATDLIRPTLGWGTLADRPVPALADYYRPGLRVDVEPGTRFAYSNNGFAVLGQVVEDVSGMPFDRYLREHVFGPLGMEHSDVVRSERVAPRLATGYELGRRGLTPVVDREMVTAGAGNVYSTTRDMIRYVAALLAGGAAEQGRLLGSATLAAMFEPHYRPDPRLPGMGLGFFRDTLGGHRIVAHDGIWKGFLSSMLLAPDDGVGVLAFANTGHFRPGGAPDEAADAVLRHLLDVPADTGNRDVPQDPTTWAQLCGWYSLGPGLLVDPQPRSMFGAGLQVVAGDHLTIGIPLLPWRLTLHPEPGDSSAFWVDLRDLIGGTAPVVFGRNDSGRVTTLHTHLGRHPMSFTKRPTIRARRWLPGGVAAGAAALAIRSRR